jgi:4-hydroxybenzoate polyprenyltransferase
MRDDPHLSELKKQTRMMAEKEAFKMAAGGLILGIVMGVYTGSLAVFFLAPIVLAFAFYWSTFRKYTKD